MFVSGMKVRYLPQPDWGVGHLVAFDEEAARAAVIFPGRGDEPAIVSTKQKALVAVALDVGLRVTLVKGGEAEILREAGVEEGLRQYVIRAGKAEQTISEAMLRAPLPSGDLVTMFGEGRFGDAKDYALREQTLKLDDERRCDALGAMLASRVRVQPHQIGVVQRVLSAPRPRFVIADEVGLGKTIEAGMIFSALRQAGLCKRVLIVVPSHLSVQWLIELQQKFNQRFVLMDSERLRNDEEGEGWRTNDHVITSLELLQRNEKHRAAVADPEAYWDLVIIDEAHHLKGEQAYVTAKGLAANAWGLLLLTATPMHVDPGEYKKLLALIDERTAPDDARLKKMMETQASLGGIVRQMLGGDRDAEATLKERFADDAALQDLSGDALIDYVAETYSLSEQLVRNRRAVVGGFADRVLHVHPVLLSEAELQGNQAALADAAKGGLRGAPLATLVKQLDSGIAQKAKAFVDLLAAIWKREDDAKILVFTEARETLDMLQARLGDQGEEALVYHGDLSLVDRDRQVARFRDPEGPRVLLCTEVGGEGRNFQFAHHLVHYDLPWSPGVIEQRIGRLDRIGQKKPISIHVFDVPGTFAAEVLALMRDAVGVFRETVGGLDAVLEEIEREIAELVLRAPADRTRYARELSERIAAAREQARRGYDPLLDLRSFDRPRMQALLERAEERLDIDPEETEEGGDRLAEGLWVVARDLEERLEDTVVHLARKVGINVDTDEQVDAFQAAFHFGYATNVDALAGLNLQEEKTVLGTFWRETAIEQEEIDYFATGHPIVEALFGMVRDGPFGRLALGVLNAKKQDTQKLDCKLGFALWFVLSAKESADTHPGARVPSRQLARFLDRQTLRVTLAVDRQGNIAAEPRLGPALDRGKLAPPNKDDVHGLRRGFAQLAPQALKAATLQSERALAALKQETAKAIALERDARTATLAHAMEYQGVKAAVKKQVLAEQAESYAAIEEALATVRYTLDSVLAFVVS
ncbi:MAG: DEAD/DEAH box helicase family protein [Deltaproteobacteria bacterium]|nr:DEAD/DEAH box helicase family protein [Deltaproteobacteria bacterium]